MLNLYICQPITSKYVAFVEREFAGYCEDTWFEPEVIQKILKEVDSVEYLGHSRFDSPVIGIIGPEDLSGTVKTLISSYQHPDLVHPCDYLGYNVAQYLKLLSDAKDITYTLNYCGFKFEDDQDILVKDWNTVIKGKDVYKQIIDRGDYEVLSKGLQFQISKDYI